MRGRNGTCSVERIDSVFVSTSFCWMSLDECRLSTLVCEFLDFVLIFFFPHKGRRVYTTIPVFFNSDPKSLYNYFQLIKITIIKKNFEKSFYHFFKENVPSTYIGSIIKTYTMNIKRY